MAATPQGNPEQVRPGDSTAYRPGPVPHPSPDERAARGKAARSAVPRSSHALFGGVPARDPVGLLELQAESRVPELVPIRYGRMLASPFAFYRGAALVMAADLAGTPRSGLSAQVCGDAHLMNFGMFGTPERRLVFDINDFDETLPGPWEWDVKRLAASLVVVGRENALAPRETRTVVLAAVQSYRETMRQFAVQPNLAVWYARLDVDEVMTAWRAQMDTRRRKLADRNLAKMRTRDSHHALAQLTELVNGERRIISDPPLIVPMEELLPERAHAELYEQFTGLVRRYRATLQEDRRTLLTQFRLTQIARKAVGVGSVGMRAFVLLMFGRDPDDPLFLQAKEAQASILEQFIGVGEYRNEGQRVVAGQRRMQASSDIFLGWERVADPRGGPTRDYYLRQLRDWKGSALVETMKPAELARYGRACGWTLARGHARSGDRIAIASYLGGKDTFDRAVADFAETYADQNERDFRALADAARTGRISARSGR